MKKELVVYIGNNKYVPVSSIPRLNDLMPDNDFLDKVKREQLLGRNECWELYKLLSVSDYESLVSDILKTHPKSQLQLINQRFSIKIRVNTQESPCIFLYSSFNETIVKMFNGRNAFIKDYKFCGPYQEYPFNYKTTSLNSHGVRRNKNGSYTLFKFDKASFQHEDGSGHKFENKYKDIKKKFNNIREILDYVVDNDLTISKSYIKDFEEWIDDYVEQDCYHGLSGFSQYLTL